MHYKKPVIISIVILIAFGMISSFCLYSRGGDYTKKQAQSNVSIDKGYTDIPYSPATKPPIYSDRTDDDSLPRCVVLRAGNVKVEVNYPDFVFPKWYLDNDTGERFNFYILLYKWTKPDEIETVLAINTEYYEDLEDIIRYSLVEPGPKYNKKTVLNGYEAALYHDEGTDIYKIPFGNRTIMVDYNTYMLSGDELKAAEEMLNSIKITQTEENIEDKIGVLSHCEK